ncbi:hypothetical protein ACQUFF_13560 [Mammaliicoccus sciuri]|uniref:hypothetical protein n=1 Tax=Mammaliicoccus sciuri TaxID=1296 RepID=UPI003D1519E7
MKYDYEGLYDRIVQNVNEYLASENELLIDNKFEKDVYICCIKIIKLLETLGETNKISTFYCDQINNELITLITLLHINNSEIKLLYIRKSAEWFMKWVYEITYKKDLNAGFKTLKEHIKQQEIYIENKYTFDNLMKIFSESSRYLHTNTNETTLEGNLKKVLFSNESIEEWRIIRNNINNILETTLFFVKFYNDNFEMSQTMRFKKFLTKTQIKLVGF